jgi:hypothetical protein
MYVCFYHEEMPDASHNKASPQSHKERKGNNQYSLFPLCSLCDFVVKSQWFLQFCTKGNGKI